MKTFSPEPENIPVLCFRVVVIRAIKIFVGTGGQICGEVRTESKTALYFFIFQCR